MPEHAGSFRSTPGGHYGLLSRRVWTAQGMIFSEKTPQMRRREGAGKRGCSFRIISVFFASFLIDLHTLM